MDRKSSSQVRSRKPNKSNADQKQEPILNFEETHVSVYDEQQFAGELLAKQFIDHLIDEGAKVLYDHYLQSKVAQHTTDTMFNLIDDIIRLQFRKQDNRFNDHSELKEEKIPKNHYDAHSAYAINIDKKLINLEEEEQVEDQFQQPTSPYRTQKTFNSTRSKLRPMSSTITEELGKTKKKKPENDLIPIPEPEQTLEDQLLMNEESKMRTLYNLQLKELQKKKEQEKLRQEEEKKIEEFKKKARKELDGKNYTYDYNGQPIFFNKKKQDQQPLVCTVPFQIKSQKNKDYKDEIIEADTSKLTQEQIEDLEKIKSIAKTGNSNHIEKAKRKQSSTSQVSNLDSTINRRSSIDSKQQIEEALKKKILNIPIEKGQEVPAKQRTLKQNVQPPAPAKANRKEEIPDEVFNNGNMRQTSMIPFITIRDGVKLTEYQNGNEVTKLPEEKPSVDQDENKKKQMTRNEYFKLIEDSRYQEPQFRQQLSNSRGTFTQRGDFSSKENIHQQEDIRRSFEKDEKEFKKQRVTSMLLEENQNHNELDEDTQKENSVYLGSVNGYKPEHIVIKDNQVKRKRITSQVDTNTQYKYNNINPNYFKNYVPNPQLNNKQETQGENKRKDNNIDSRAKRSFTHDNSGQQQVQLKVQIESNKEQQKGDTQGVILPVIPAFQKKKQAVLQDIFNQDQKRATSSKQRQRIKNNSLTTAHPINNGNEINNSGQNNRLNVTHLDQFAITKTKLSNAAPKYLNNQKYLNKSFDISGPHKKHSTTLVEQNIRDKQAAQLEKNRNIITFGKKEELVQLLINE